MDTFVSHGLLPMNANSLLGPALVTSYRPLWSFERIPAATPSGCAWRRITLFVRSPYMDVDYGCLSSNERSGV